MNYSWERAFVKGYTYLIDDLECALILNTASKTGELNQLAKVSLELKVRKLLEEWQLLKDNEIVNAAVVLFGKPHISKCQLKMVCYKEASRQEVIFDNLIKGNIFHLLNEGMAFIKRHMPSRTLIQFNTREKITIPAIPLHAIQEMLINALCHSDYSLGKNVINITFYGDSMEITNEGGLLEGVTLEFIKTTFSKLRNPIIANFLNRYNLKSGSGSGIQKIIRDCVAAGCPKIEFHATSTQFKILLKFSSNIKPEIDFIKEEFKKFDILSERQKEIIKILANTKCIKMTKLIKEFEGLFNKKILRKDLESLRKLGIVGSRGNSNAAMWFLKKIKPDTVNY